MSDVPDSAIMNARPAHADASIVAAPVMSMEAYGLIASLADRCYCLAVPEAFGTVAEHYADFQQLADADVRRLLTWARQSLSTRPPREKGS